MNNLIFQKDCCHVWSKNSILVDFLGNRNGASAKFIISTVVFKQASLIKAYMKCNVLIQGYLSKV